MSPSAWALLVVILAAMVNMASQIAAYRLLRTDGKLFRSQIAGTLIGGLALAVGLSASPGSRMSGDAATAGCLLYLAFCYVYFHWNNMGETARRIRMLRELAAAPAGLSFDEMVARYSAREILERRLERLRGAAQITEINGRLVLTSRAVLLSACLVGLAKQAIFGGRSELDAHDHITL